MHNAQNINVCNHKCRYQLCMNEYLQFMIGLWPALEGVDDSEGCGLVLVIGGLDGLAAGLVGVCLMPFPSGEVAEK